jgi:hypothetical protein
MRSNLLALRAAVMLGALSAWKENSPNFWFTAFSEVQRNQERS